MYFERTIKKNIIFEGDTLYSNVLNKVICYPAEEYTGIYINNVLVNGNNLNFTNDYTKIGNIYLIEHLLSALYSLGINNLFIYSKENEIPIVDGASRYFYDLFKDNIKEYESKKEVIKVNNKIRYEINQKENKLLNHKKRIRFIEITKDNDFNIDCKVNFPYSGNQRYILNSMHDYYNDISPFKTHMNKEYYEFYKKKMNLKYENIDRVMFVYDQNTIFKCNELARHKVLDIIGDIALIGVSVFGKINAFCSGHYLHQNLSKKIFNLYESINLNINIKKISKEEADNIIINKKMRVYHKIKHFSFNLKYYKEYYLIEEDNKYYIFMNKPLDHWSPLYVLTNNESNYLPYYIRNIKNCILCKTNEKMKELNKDVRYYWYSECNFEKYLKFRDKISNKPHKHFPSSKTYQKYKNIINEYEILIKDFSQKNWENHYNILKRPEHKEASKIPIPNIEKEKIKLCFMKKKNKEEVLFVAALAINDKSLSVLNLASKLSSIKYNIGIGFLGCFKLFKYCCDNDYNSFDFGISKAYGCYKNKLSTKIYQFNEKLDFSV
jgi:UDP-3-O-[3-hydroxymyristoyl] N-acetylglucosamine deacetylase